MNEASVETYNQNIEDEVRTEETLEMLEDDNNENENPNKIPSNNLNRDLDS